MRLVNYFADQFNKQLGNGVDIRQSPKAMAKLKKQVKRTKEILSANTAAPISVESLYDDVDFRFFSTLLLYTVDAYHLVREYGCSM
jgi:hypoxia up-regulated 1